MPKKDEDEKDEGFHPEYQDKLVNDQLVVGKEAKHRTRRFFTKEEVQQLLDLMEPASKRMQPKWLFFRHELEYRAYGKANDITQRLCDRAFKKGHKPTVMQVDVVRGLGVQVKGDTKTLPAVKKIIQEYNLTKLVEAGQTVQLCALAIHKHAKHVDDPKKKKQVEYAKSTLNSHQNFKLAVANDTAQSSQSSISGSESEFEFEAEVEGDATSDDDGVSTSSVLETASQAAAKRKAADLAKVSRALKKRKAKAKMDKLKKKLPKGVSTTPNAGEAKEAGVPVPVTGTPGKKVTIGGQEYDEGFTLNLLQMFSAVAKGGAKVDQAAQDGAPVAPSGQVPPQDATTAGVGVFFTPQKGQRPCEFASLDPNHGICDPLSGREVCGYATCDRCKGNKKPFAPYCSVFSKCGWKSCSICKGT